MTKRVICSSATGPHIAFLAANRPLLHAYAERYGYDLVLETPEAAKSRLPQRLAGSKLLRQYDRVLMRILLASMNRMPLSAKAARPVPGPSFIDAGVLVFLRLLAGMTVAPMPAAWIKVGLVRRMLEQYETVVWIDADAVLVDLSVDIATELSPNKWISMVEHHFADGTSHLNTGVFVVRSSPVAKQFWRDVAHMTPLRDHKWWEQAAVLYLIGYDLKSVRQFRATKYSEGVALMDGRWNSIPLGGVAFPRINHYAGLTNTSRATLIDRDVKDSLARLACSNREPIAGRASSSS